MTDSDNRLLELAAKAAGWTLTRWNQMYACYETSEGLWNPLLNDGDALRLAIRLGIDFKHDRHNRLIIVDGDALTYDESKFGGDCDPYAATRRAIVCAAAKLGELT